MEKIFMKLAVTLSLFAVVSLSSSLASYGKGTRTDSDGHELVSLWKDYRRLQDEDRPDKEMEVLEKIMLQSEKRHIPWDFYDAWKKYRDAVLSRDWKQREAVDSAMAAAVRRFDEPVVSYAACQDLAVGRTDMRDMLCRLRENAPRLQSVRNPQFYRTGYNHVYSSFYNVLPESVIHDIANDYEYVLWSLLLSSRGSEKQVYEMLSECVAGRYPSGPYLEYSKTVYMPSEDRRAALESFIGKYTGRAVVCYAVQDELSLRFFGMLSEEDTLTSDDFTEFRKECEDFEKMRKGFSGKEKTIADDCTEVKDILESLDAETVRVNSRGDTLDVLLRNMDRAVVEVFPDADKDAAPVFSADLANVRNSYYVTDTLRTLLPDIDDGTYLVKCTAGDKTVQIEHVRHRISVAYRRSGDGIAVYAADMESGRPVEADVEFFKGDSLVYSFPDIDFSSGFVSLPCGFVGNLENYRGYALVCSFRDAGGVLHSSGKTGIDWFVFHDYGYQEGVSAEIFKDRAVYDYGDTVYFKTVLYRPSDTPTGLGTLPAGEKVKMTLSDPRNASLDSVILMTNDFGSVSGSFAVPSGGLGGRFLLEASYGGRTIASSSFVAGEIDIPTFDLEFDDDDILHFPGDSMIVSGTVTAYTGHSLSSASLYWHVSGPGMSEEGTAAIAGDGRFSFGFKDSGEKDYSSYSISVRVSDVTGETAEFTRRMTVSGRFTLDIEAEGTPDGIVTPAASAGYGLMPDYRISLTGDTACVKFIVRNADYRQVSTVPVRYSVYHGNELVCADEVMSGDETAINLYGRESGIYRIEAEASAVLPLKEGGDSLLVCRYIYDMVKTSERDASLDADVENIFKVIEEEDIVLQIGTTAGPMWAVAELWGGGDEPLATGMVCLDGGKGKEGSMTVLRYAYKDSWPDDTRLEILYFRNGRDYRYSADYHRKTSGLDLPLDFVSFTDSTSPDADVSFTLKTAPGVEAVIAVSDKGADRIMPDRWYPVYRNGVLPYLQISVDNGFVGGRPLYLRGDVNSFMAAKAAVPESSTEAAYDTALDESAAGSSEDMYGKTVPVRSDFRNTLAFIPAARSGEDGVVSVNFRTSDKISTYKVSVFAHDKSMRNGVSVRDLLVTKPVAVSVFRPRFLREGDIYAADVSVSNGTEEKMSGALELFVYDSGDYLDASPSMARSIPVTMESGESASGSFTVRVPAETDTLGFKFVYEGCRDGQTGCGNTCGWSDGVFVSVPVLPDTQVLTESHSAVLLSGMSADSLKTRLSAQFVNTLPYGAVSREICLLDMVKEAIPQKAKAAGRDAVSLSDAIFVRMLTGAVYGADADSLVTALSECRNADGGVAWFSGMESSPAVTALLLERAAEISSRTHVRIFTDEQTDAALEYMDRLILGREGGVSLPEYLYVRSMYSSVPLAADPSDSGKAVKALRKSVKNYLSAPSGAEEFDGRLIDKARRVAVSMAFLSDGGEVLPESMGFGKSFLRKMAKTVGRDVASLCSYAVKHGSGGICFPNAVMPFRGLLDSELYAHSLICDVLQDYAAWSHGGKKNPSGDMAADAAHVADGVRLWMMLQKDTQQWDNDPAYAMAMASVLDGTSELLDTKILVVSKQYCKPFEGIKAAGNGLSVSRSVFRAASPSGKDLQEIAPGDTIRVGDRIVCRYTVKSSDSRSFVRLTVPHYAFMRPAYQISGITGYQRQSSVLPPAFRAYRNVLADRTEYYFDVMPEDVTVIEEVFFITHGGKCSSPVSEVECLYAPHYRANDGYEGCLRSYQR